MIDDKTIEVYNAQVEDYLEVVQQHAADPGLEQFMAWLEPDDLVLDLGCGPAHASAAMREEGLRVDPVDASPAMVEMANKQFQIGARLATFDDIDQVEHYDGVWANFSLLHAPANRFPHHIKALYTALVDGGIFHLALKPGSGEKRDKLGRMYSYYSENELVGMLENTGFEIDEITHGEGMGLAGDVEPWIVVLCCKAH
ncbi:MAG: class I SAM-dependent DNA methyltransferase [Granulosicoccaceae bacterium]